MRSLTETLLAELNTGISTPEFFDALLRYAGPAEQEILQLGHGGERHNTAIGDLAALLQIEHLEIREECEMIGEGLNVGITDGMLVIVP
jgi:hypothetical protein